MVGHSSLATHGRDYSIEVVAFQLAAGDESARLEIMVESDSETSQGALAIRKKLVELHEKLLGVTVVVDSPEVEAAFQMFVEVWERKRLADDWRDESVECSFDDDILYFDGIDDEARYSKYDGKSGWVFDWDRVGKILDEANWKEEGLQDPIVQTWVVVLAYLMTDYRYLFSLGA